MVLQTGPRTIKVKRTIVEYVDVPEGYIRFTDALEKYALPPSRLGVWVHRGLVRNHKVSRHLSFVNEADIQERMSRT